MALTRLVTLDDAPALAQLVAENRKYLTPWWPAQPETYFTEDGQHALLTRDLAARDRGAMHPLAVRRGHAGAQHSVTARTGA